MEGRCWTGFHVMMSSTSRFHMWRRFIGYKFTANLSTYLYTQFYTIVCFHVEEYLVLKVVQFGRWVKYSYTCSWVRYLTWLVLVKRSIGRSSTISHVAIDLGLGGLAHMPHHER